MRDAIERDRHVKIAAAVHRGDMDRCERIGLGVQHRSQHVVARPGHRRLGRTRAESGLEAQVLLVDDEPVEPHEEVRASQGRRNEALHVVTRDDVIVAEAREPAGTMHFQHDERTRGLDRVDEFAACDRRAVIALGKSRRTRGFDALLRCDAFRGRKRRCAGGRERRDERHREKDARASMPGRAVHLATCHGTTDVSCRARASISSASARN